uniref:F-box/LRR-repeat protein 19 n=1 Tax=Nicotiana tabacum TaxID=4097 RepID=A0A1S4B4X3_TOBAC|nr:PREDICTED: putative F-box/LRR-repeat protein 19 [Nicotiana tabacum]
MDGNKERKDGHDWSELTQLCLVDIVSRLSIEDRWHGYMLVCKAWFEVCKDPTLNSVIDLEDQFDSATELSPYCTHEFEHKMDNMLRSVVLWSGGSLTTVRDRETVSDIPSVKEGERSPDSKHSFGFSIVTCDLRGILSGFSFPFMLVKSINGLEFLLGQV